MRSLAILAAVMLLAGCISRPPLVRDLPGSWPDASAEMTRRLQAGSPLGSPESALVSELRRQHLKVDVARRYAEFSKSRFPCAYVWAVRWKADEAGRLTGLEGQAYAVCP